MNFTSGTISWGQPSTWNPRHTCHDCSGPRYGNTVRCGRCNIMHRMRQLGITLDHPRQDIWSYPGGNTVQEPDRQDLPDSLRAEAPG